MELSLKYVYTVWEKKSFSNAAKVLFVSQPALSSTVAKLEKELGFKIFDRSTSPISLTPRGKVYMDFVEEIFQNENLMKQRILAMDNMCYGQLTIGGGRIYSAYHILPIICGQFYQKYPKVNLTIDMDTTEEKLKKNMVELILSFNSDNTEYEAIPLLEEQLIFVMNKKMPLAEQLAPYAVTRQQIINRDIQPNQTIDDLSVFKDIPFIKTGKGSDSDRRLSMMLKNHKVAPYVIVNAKTFEMRYKMMQKCIGAVLVTDLFLATHTDKTDDLLYFVPKNPDSRRTLYLRHRKKSINNEVLNKFIAVAKDCCKSDRILLNLNE